MALQKSPGGSIFPYYYKSGELFGLHLGSFFGNETALLERMRAEEEFIRMMNHPLPLWIDLYEDRLTDGFLVEFLKSMVRLQSYIPRLAIVGCSRLDRWRMNRIAKKNGLRLEMPVRFFSDPEEAKTWLVSERK